MSDPPNPLLLPDTQSRYEIKTRTANGEWDQVVAVSQDIVNTNLEAMFNSYQAEMKTMYYESDVFGRIDAELEASRIIIPTGALGTKTTELLYQMRFKSGQLFSADGSLAHEDLSGTVISYPIELGQFSDDPAKTPKGISAYSLETQQKITKSLRETIRVEEKALPTDYSIERLYTKLSSANFKDPDKETSFFGQGENGPPIPFGQWTSENFEAYGQLRNWLEKWAIDQDKNGRNVFGFSVQLTEDKAKQKRATYESRDLVYQTYAYKNKDLINGETGLGGYGGRNSLLYCEMTSASIQHNEQTQETKLLRSRPASLPLIWSGNFTTMPSSSSANDGINGTFLLNREVILGTFLLPNFCKLNQASEVWHKTPTATPEGRRHICSTPYLISVDERYPDSSDPIYAFTNKNALSAVEQEKPAQYVWEKTNRNPEPGQNDGWIYFNHPDPYGSDVRVQTCDKLRTEVLWQPGASTMTIRGTIDMEVNMQWAQAQVANDWNKDNLWAYSMTKWTGGWSMTATFSTREGVNGNGIMAINIDAGPEKDGSFHLGVVGESDRKNMETPDYSAEIKDNIQRRFKDVIPAIAQDLSSKLGGSGAFTFPGSGVFSFKNPVLTRWGDVAAQIEYLPLPVEKRLIVIPGMAKPVNPGPPPHVIMQPHASPAPGQYVLKWTRSPTAEERFEGRRRNKLVWRGINLRNGLVTFREIRIIFTARASNDSLHLFHEDNFYVEGQEPKPKEEPVKPPMPKDGDEPVINPKEGNGSIGDPKKGNKPITTLKNGDGPVIHTKEDDSTSVSRVHGQPVDGTRPAEDVNRTIEAGNLETAVGAPVDPLPVDTAPIASASVTTTPINSAASSDLGKLPASTTGVTSQSIAPEPSSNNHILSNVGSGLKDMVDRGAELLRGGPPPELKHGILRLRQKKNGHTATLAVVPQSKPGSKTKVSKWTATIDDKSTVLRLEPNDWVELELEGMVAGAGNYIVTIEEAYETGDKLVWKQDFPITVTSAAPKRD